ncbi:MAG: hypothetical protein AMJ78_00825 [Omnitrophica WOR_2 bacterium SM23_29]|nr:MAG: hypothetical protein AMJ78_00825 [Omnitrophica WOR_2 bacterium SM23_29]
MTIKRLYDLVEKEGIAIENYPLPQGISGHYCVIDKVAIITLKVGLSEKEEKCILAAELGHHFSPCFNISIPKNEQEKISVVRQEKISLKWAAKQLIDKSRLVRLLKQEDPPSFAELCEEFDVIPRLMEIMLEEIIKEDNRC